MCADVLERAIARLEDLKSGAFPVPYEPGVAGGGHWYLFHDRETVAYVTANDGSDEEQREPTARLIAAMSRTVDPVLDILRFCRGLYGAQIQGEQAAATVDLGLCLARAILGEVEHD